MADLNSDAVIFLPGIKGTTLVNTNRADYDTIWSAIQSQFEDIEMLELSLDDKGFGYDSRQSSLIKAGQIEGLVYSEFLRDIQSSKPIYLFNYDWRQSSIENAKRLQAFMDMLKTKSKVSQKFAKPIKRFDVIAHSHGSNVLRQFTKLEGFRRLGRVILAAPPLRGSLDTVDAILTGEGVFPGVRAKVRKLIRTFPGALELLPSYGAAEFDDGSEVDFFKAAHWQANITSTNNSYSEKFKKTLKCSEQAKEHLHDWSGLRKDIRDRILIIVRDGYDTAQSLTVHKNMLNEPKNYIDLANIHFSSNGDGTVSHGSSCIWADKILTLVATDSWRYRDYGHGFILKDERVQRMVRRFLIDNKDFEWKTPGHSVKRVSSLKTTEHESGLKDWTIEME